jgi:hypothetical protein
MKTLLVSLIAFVVSLIAFGVGVSIAAAQTSGGSAYSSSSSAYSNSSRCNTVELKPGESLPLATPTASPPSGRRKKHAEPPGAIPIPSLADGSKVVTDANGGCTTYRYKAR